jgi:hypothetical protein
LNGGYKNYGQQRKAEVHARNAERKAYKEESKAERRYGVQPYYTQPYLQQRYPSERRYRQTVPYYGQSYTQPYYQQPQQQYYYQQQQYPYYQQPYNGGTYSQPYYGGVYSQPYYGQYAPGYNGYSDGRLDVGDLLRNIVFSVIADQTGLNSGYYGQDNGYGYIQGYSPAAYGGYSPYAAYGPAPYYSNASYGMGGSYDSQYTAPYGYDYSNEQLPLQVLVADNGLTGEMTRELLALGYEQGYQHGLAARQARLREEAFYDPYAYNNEAYDPYSISLGDNRRFLSQGYELGYDDALNNVDDYQRVAGDGGVDLVSLLIGTVSQLI